MFASTSNTFRNARMAANFQTALTLDAVRAAAPSAFAAAKHESRSDRYTYIPTSEVIAGLMHHGFQPFKAAQSRSRIEGKSEFTKHMIRFRHPDAVLQGDSFPEVVLINSHDGTSAYKLMAGIFRLICTNGLIIADSVTGSLSVQHKGNIVDQVIDGSFQIIGESQKALQTADIWGRLRLTAGEQAAYAEAAHTLRFDERETADAGVTVNTPITAAQLLRPRRPEDAGEVTDYRRATLPASDLWRTMNVVQENVISGGLRGRAERRDDRGRLLSSRRVTTRPVQGIDQDVKLNRALWKLAERMAELKGVTAAA
jgi:hypothetical protein